MVEKMKVGIYARVSTGKQEESLEEQIKSLERYCGMKGLEVVKVYSEVISGAKNERTQLEELMRDAQEGKLEGVVVLKLDRFSRSMLDLLTNVEKLKNSQVDFISVNDNIETYTPQGKLIFHIMGALAEFEQSLIYERTKIGIDRAKREGKICHRPRKEIDLERVTDRYKKGLSLEDIATLEKISLSTLRDRLRAENIDIKKLREERNDK